MGRNKRQRRPGRRRRNSRENCSDDDADDEGAVTLSTIEDDLRQQRLRQQERQCLRQQAEQTEQTKSAKGEEIESSPCEDDIPDFLPSQYNISSSYYLYHRGLHLNHDVTSVSSLVLSYAQELGPGPAASAWPVLPGNRHSHHHLPCPTNTSRLRHIWYGRHLVQHLQVHAKALTLYSQAKWSQYQLPHGWYCPWDLTCKYHSHPSARTLDVSMMNRRTITQHPTNSSSSLYYPLPTMVSAVQGGFVLCQPGIEEEDSNVEFNHGTVRRRQSSVASASLSSRNRSICNGRVHTIRGEPIHSVRLYHSKNTSAVEGARGYIGTLTSVPERRQASHQLKLYDLRNGHVFANETLHVPVNDLCFGQDLILLAPSLVSSSSGNGSGTDRLSPLFVPLRREGGGGGFSSSSLRTLQVDNFPQSDALRVELASREKLVAFGHRNGQVSLLDLRNSTSCCGATNPGSTKGNGSGLTDAPIGSATDLALLPSQQQLVVKYSFGSCQLHDLRKLSSFSPSLPSPVSPPHPGAVHRQQQQPARSTAPNTSSGTPSSLVWNLSVPEHFHCHGTRSSRCNGLALDHPTTNAQVVFAPYMNKDNESCLGSWSLRTGMFLGSKLLLAGNNQNPNQTSGGDDEEDLIFTELCQQTTPAYYSLSSSNAAPPRQPGRSRGSSSSLPSTSASSSSSFGLWLKCGRFSRNGTHSKAGSLHHVVVPGQWEEPI